MPAAPPGSAKRRFIGVCRAAIRGKAPSHTMRFCRSLVEPEMDERADEVAGLRVAHADGVIDRAGDGIRRAGAIRLRVPEERHDVARRGEADAEHQRISRRVDKIVEATGAEPVLQADARWVRSAGPRRRLAVGEGPVVACDGLRRVLLAGIGLACVPREACVRLFEIRREIRLRGAQRSETDWRRRRAVRHIVEARDDGTGDCGSVPIPCDRHHDALVVCRRDHVSLPAADERHVPSGLATAWPLPRLTTWYRSTRAAFDISTGLARANVATYSTFPSAFLGAMSRS